MTHFQFSIYVNKIKNQKSKDIAFFIQTQITHNLSILKQQHFIRIMKTGVNHIWNLQCLLSNCLSCSFFQPIRVTHRETLQVINTTLTPGNALAMHLEMIWMDDSELEWNECGELG